MVRHDELLCSPKGFWPNVDNEPFYKFQSPPWEVPRKRKSGGTISSLNAFVAKDNALLLDKDLITKNKYYLISQEACESRNNTPNCGLICNTSVNNPAKFNSVLPNYPPSDLYNPLIGKPQLMNSDYFYKSNSSFNSSDNSNSSYHTNNIHKVTNVFSDANSSHSNNFNSHIRSDQNNNVTFYSPICSEQFTSAPFFNMNSNTETLYLNNSDQIHKNHQLDNNCPINSRNSHFTSVKIPNNPDLFSRSTEKDLHSINSSS